MKLPRLILLLFLLPLTVWAQIKTPQFTFRGNTWVSNANTAPFWQFANTYNINNNQKVGAVGLVGMFTKTVDTTLYDYNYGIEMLTRYDKNEQSYLHQGYISGRFWIATAYFGRKEEVFGSQIPELSSGGIVWSGNARPMTKVAIEVLNYTPVPFTNEFVEFKGGLSHGWFENYNRSVSHILLHHKYLFGRFGGKLPLHISVGMHHFAQWGGYAYDPVFKGWQPQKFNDYITIFFAKQKPVADNVFWAEAFNKIGNHLGSRQYCIDYNFEQSEIGLYFNTYFEDGTGNHWFTRHGDGLWGMYYKNKVQSQFCQQLTFEFLKTSYQSGPIETEKKILKIENGDTTFIMDNKYGGNDNYFNHYMYQSFTYYGNTIGSPLITSPSILHGADPLTILNNRVLGYHAGGLFNCKIFNLRVLYTFSINMGSYSNPIAKNLNQNSFLFEFSRNIQKLNNTNVKLTITGNKGELLENAAGIMLGVVKKWN